MKKQVSSTKVTTTKVSRITPVKQLALRQEKVDWLKIVNMAFKRKDWGKTFVLYTYGKTTITCSLWEFNFEEEVAWFKLNVTSEQGENYTTIRYQLNNFTIADFTMHLSKKIVSLLSYTTDTIKTRIAEHKYHKLQFFCWNINEKQIIAAGLEEDLKKIKKFGSVELRRNCMSNLEVRAKNILNVPFEALVKHHIEINPLMIEGFNEITNLLKTKVKEE